MKIRIAMPTKGRLEVPAADLFRQAGFRFERTERSLSVPVQDAPIELLFVRTKDVAELVADGVADLGITGLDMVVEAGAHVSVASDLGFGRCSLVAAVPDGSNVTSIEDFAGLRIATSHPSTVSSFFAGKGIDVVPIPLSGSVEVAPKLDIADAVVDLVSSGSTMLVNGLRPICTILESQAVMVERMGADRSSTTDRVLTMLVAAMAAKRKRYLVMNAPESAIEDIARIIPGIEAPTVVPLTAKDMVAVHSVVDAADVWHVLPRLSDAGATGILVLPVHQVLA
jgi:ATP phosphoribosyltransferase